MTETRETLKLAIVKQIIDVGTCELFERGAPSESHGKFREGEDWTGRHSEW